MEENIDDQCCKTLGIADNNVNKEDEKRDLKVLFSKDINDDEIKNITYNEEINLIGKGTYSSVYDCSNSKYVLKKLNSNFVYTSEIDILFNLQHENILKAKALLNIDNYITFVLEKCDHTLYRLLNIMIKRNVVISDSIKTDICYQIALGVEHIHNNNYLHLDLTPSNILLILNNERYIVKISDFSISTKSVNDCITTYHEAITCEYRPLENFYNNNYEKRSDVYSLGLIFYSLFTVKHIPSYITQLANSIRKEQFLSDKRNNNTYNVLMYLKKKNIWFSCHLPIVNKMISCYKSDRCYIEEVLQNDLFDKYHNKQSFSGKYSVLSESSCDSLFENLSTVTNIIYQDCTKYEARLKGELDLKKSGNKLKHVFEGAKILFEKCTDMIFPHPQYYLYINCFFIIYRLYHTSFSLKYFLKKDENVIKDYFKYEMMIITFVKGELS